LEGAVHLVGVDKAVDLATGAVEVSVRRQDIDSRSGSGDVKTRCAGKVQNGIGFQCVNRTGVELAALLVAAPVVVVHSLKARRSAGAVQVAAHIYDRAGPCGDVDIEVPLSCDLARGQVEDVDARCARQFHRGGPHQNGPTGCSGARPRAALRGQVAIYRPKGW
jgi:hypothetical protein